MTKKQAKLEVTEFIPKSKRRYKIKPLKIKLLIPVQLNDATFVWTP